MPEQRSVIAFTHYWESEQRFEYFITGISTALCAYVGQTLQPQKFGFNAYTLEVFSLALVVISIIFGFKRIELGIALKSWNHQMLHLGEVRGALVTMQGTGGFDRVSGGFVTAENVPKEINAINEQLPIVERNLNAIQADILRYYDYRNAFLLLGFIGLFVSKILVPYTETTPSLH
jgi:hypothetical protein